MALKKKINTQTDLHASLETESMTDGKNTPGFIQPEVPEKNDIGEIQEREPEYMAAHAKANHGTVREQLIDVLASMDEREFEYLLDNLARNWCSGKDEIVSKIDTAASERMDKMNSQSVLNKISSILNI